MATEPVATGRPDERRRRFDLAVLAWMVSGLAFRAAQTFPFHRFTAESDCIMPAVGALRVLNGEWPVFYSGFRIGALCNYLTASVFAILGASRSSLAIEPLVACTLLLVVWFGFVRALVSREVALWALPFVAIPTWSFALWTYEPLAYGEVYLVFAAILWAAVVARRRRTLNAFVLFGLAAGLGWWTSPLTLGASAPAALWLAPSLVGRRSGERGPIAVLAAVALAAVLGAAPWIAFNLRYGFLSLRSDYSARPASGLGQVVENVAYFATVSVRELTASDYRAPGAPPLEGPRKTLQDVTWSLALAGFVIFALRLPRRRGVAGEPEVDQRAAWVLVLLVVAAIASLNIVSYAGSLRGFTGRYVGPIYLVLPIAYGTVLHALSRRSRIAAVALVAIGLAAHLEAAMLPGDPERRLAESQLVRDLELRRAIKESGVRTVFGEYWASYHFNFPDDGFIVVPTLPSYDYGQVARRMEIGAPWALVQPDMLTLRWLKHSPLAREVVIDRVPVFNILPDRFERMTPEAIESIRDWWWVP